MLHERKIDLRETASPTRTCRLPDVSVAEARARLIAALGAHGFAVLWETNLADLLNRRLDTTREAFLLVEGCHPKLAELALTVASDAGLLASFRFAVWKEGTGAVIATLAPTRLAVALGREHLADFARQADQQLDVLFAMLDRPVSAEPLPGPSATVMLDDAERTALKEAATRHLQCLLTEAAGTGSHDLQHGLAQMMSRLEQALRKL
jgi:uncharacterized protein (DUF302 family)